jgi:putative membrane protein (TIGR04086 family)
MRLDWRAVALGGVAALIIAAPAALIAQALYSADTISDRSNWVFLFTAVILAGCAVGGYVAGRKRPDAPLAHGALAALAAFVVVQGIGIVVRLIDGDSIDAIKIVFNAMLSAAVGLLGGLLSSRRRTAASA